MRLLRRQDDGRLTLTEYHGDNIPPYAILSHTWGADDEEVVFRDIVGGGSRQKKDSGYRKIEFCADRAAADSLHYFWIDSCCIDKSSSAELQEAITSMFGWYQKAKKCYVYLSDVTCDEEHNWSTWPPWEFLFRKSRWFTRGWTLQELLAPPIVEFFSKDGRKLGTKTSLDQLLQEVTGITIGAFHGEKLSNFSISDRMSWSRGRKTKRSEDKAYSLFGIFDVSTYINYGEGEDRAMNRLRNEIDQRVNLTRMWNKRPPGTGDTVRIDPKRQRRDGKAHDETETEGSPSGEPARDHRQSLMASIWFEKMDSRHSDIRSAHRMTCAWLLSHPDYVGWLAPAEFPQHHGLLWIRGKPGAGKSTLMKYIYANASKSTDITISFFFNARGDGLEKSTEGMYRSLLHQLLEKLPDLQEVLDSARCHYQNSNDQYAWKIEDLQGLFSAAILRLGQRRVRCFVDALDECDEAEVRDMIEYFEQLAKTALEVKEMLYICFSSRHYPTLHIPHGRTLTLEDQPGHSQDLEKYVQSRLHIKTAKDADWVRTELLEKAAGVFMWVVLVVGILNEEYLSGRMFAVKKRLDEIPAKLSDLFRDILMRDKKNIADLLLSIQWILYAKRPMKPEEFYYAVVAGLDPEPENLTEWDPENITVDDINRFVLSSSKGLAEITKSKIKTVQFIHESVRDFLLKEGGIRDLVPNSGGDFQSQSHDRLKGCCYAYMKTDISKYVSFGQELPKPSSVEGKALRQQISKKFPFLEYATHQILYHADAATTVSPQHDFLKNFDLRVWINLDNLFAKFEIRRHTSSASLAYILAEYNWARLIRCMLHYDSSVHIHGERYEYPLFAALTNGHREAVGALLQLENEPCGENGITARLGYGKNFEAVKGQTPLRWAANNGHKEILQLLINKYPNVDVQDQRGWSPLLWASFEGHAEVVKLLLDRHADIEAEGVRGMTPLLWASSEGHAEVVKLLLDRHANIEAVDYKSRTPLLWASSKGHAEVVKLLLNRHANIEAVDNEGITPLSWASSKGHAEVAELLLDRHANIEAAGVNSTPPLSRSSFKSWTPLLWASSEGHAEVVKLLLDRHANIEAGGVGGIIPLLRASSKGHTEVVNLLQSASILKGQH